MKPVFLVFCEGETEETYLDYLKQAYRSPIKIIPKVEGGDISQRLTVYGNPLYTVENAWRTSR